MGFFSNYTITTDCLLQFFFLEQHSSSGGDVPEPRKFPPQLRVHSFHFDYDNLQPSPSQKLVPVATVAEGDKPGVGEDPRFAAGISFRRTDGDLVEAEVSMNISRKSSNLRFFLIPPDTSVPFMVNVYGSDNEEETKHTALVLHGVFRGGRRNGLLDVVKYIFVGLGRKP